MTTTVYGLYLSQSGLVRSVQKQFTLTRIDDSLAYLTMLHNIADCYPHFSEFLEEAARMIDLHVIASTTRVGGGTGQGPDGENSGRGEQTKKRARTSSAGGTNSKTQPGTSHALHEAGYLLVKSLNHRKVYLGQSGSGCNVVVKIVPRYSTEISYFELCQGPNVVPLLARVDDSMDTCLVMPLLSVLGDFLLPGYREDIADSLFSMSVDLARGLTFLHSHRIAHCDLKPNNLLFDEHKKLMIADFGSAVLVDSDETLVDGIRGTEGWTAPETDKRRPFSPIRADLYSCGLVYRAIIYFMPASSQDESARLLAFSKRLRHEDPTQRPSLQEWMNSPLSPATRGTFTAPPFRLR
ncbi:kinase-like protein [Gymnopus androsaceus JB14]|uniref:Kinase-like protein n=1 Tax=Gymnopus androsaceus JB14 TaxID=1447944 RepID=A0A6A4IDK2_9AGAR|nr:kinase-like protein [Gymnopus androsaceus JB14]